jgi:hypothetical protein
MKRISCVVVLAMLATASASPARQYSCQLGTQICNKLSNGTADPNCPKIPISLFVANGGPANGELGWLNNGTQCGININTKKSCGDKLGNSCCNCDVNNEPPCDIDPDFPGCFPYPTNPCGVGGAEDNPCLDSAPVPAPPSSVATRLTSLQQAMPSNAEQALSALAGVKSMHLIAKATLTQHDAKAGTLPQRSVADFEYWESGNAYRMHSTLDASAGFVDIPELAYTGHYLQMLTGSAADNSVLNVRAGDDRTTVFPLDNPLFLAFSYLSPEDSESCPGCQLRLADLRYLMAVRTGTHSLAPASRVAASNQEEVTFPGGRSYGEGHPSTSYHLTLDTNSRVVSIKNVDAAGHLLRQVDLADFQRVDGLGVELPRSVTFSQTNEGESTPWLVAQYEISTIEVNTKIPASTYDLVSLPRVHKIWDSDLNRFVKYQPNATDAACPQGKMADPK